MIRISVCLLWLCSSALPCLAIAQSRSGQPIGTRASSVGAPNGAPRPSTAGPSVGSKKNSSEPKVVGLADALNLCVVRGDDCRAYQVNANQTTPGIAYFGSAFGERHPTYLYVRMLSVDDWNAAKGGVRCDAGARVWWQDKVTARTDAQLEGQLSNIDRWVAEYASPYRYLLVWCPSVGGEASYRSWWLQIERNR